LKYPKPIILNINLHHSFRVVPGIEEIHAKDVAENDNIHVYYKHPIEKVTKKDHMEYIKEFLKGCSSGAKIGVDLNHTPGNIIDLIQQNGFTFTDLGGFIEQMRYV